MILFGEKLDQLVALIISDTKCDRDKLIFSAERGGQSDINEASTIK